MTEVFPKAPLTEALIDIRLKLPGNVCLADLEKLHDRIRDQYPARQTRTMWQGTFEMKDAKDPLQRAQFQVDGYVFTSGDGRQVVQYRLDGFTFSRLRPYTRWEEVFSEAQRLWGIYVIGTKPLLITGVAVRYINSIEIPSKTLDYDEYFTAAPRIPPALPQGLSHFFTRLAIPFPDRGALAVITQTPSDTRDPINTVIILDIAVSKETNLSPEDRMIFEVLSILRDIKNEIFFSSVTDKTKELFR